MKIDSPLAITELLVSGNAEISGSLNITGDILPTVTEQFDLGSDSLRFKDIYLSGSTIFLGNVKLSESEEGTLKIINASEEVVVVGEVNTEEIDGRLDSLETESGSIRNTLNSFTSSLSNVNNTADIDKPLSTLQKIYVDEVAQGLKTRSSARVLVDSNLDATYNNGTNGSGSFLEANSNGAFPTTDGVDTLELNIVDIRILVIGQTNKAHNGLYVVQTPGDSETPWKIRRCRECDSDEEIPGSYVFVKSGTVYGNTGWVMLVDNPATFTVGENAITPTQFSGAGSFLAGSGLELEGNLFSLNTGSVHFTSGVKIKLNADTVVSSSAQVTSMLPSGLISGSSQIAINSTDGTLNVNKGGTGATSITANKLLIGNGTSAVFTNNNLHWDNSNTRLGIGTASPGSTLQVAGNVTPSANATHDLGSSTLRWNTVYTSDLSLKNDFGDWTIVEGEDDLFLYNNKKNKVYKFALTEVDPETAPPKRS